MFYKGDKMKICIGFDLTDKKVGKIDVAGLAELWLDPTNKGIGRKVLLMIEAIASDKIVVGFAKAASVGFYKSCDWYVEQRSDDIWLVASEPIDTTDFNNEIW